MESMEDALGRPQHAKAGGSHKPLAKESKDAYFRNLYTKAPDFKAIALLDPDFAAVIKGRDLNFNDPKAVMQLTKTLLKVDFDLHVELPDDRLCPPVANRHNYILWLKDLLDTTSYDEPGRKVVGLDIGTGASCIYPLLGCAQRPWSFIATDIDDKSLEWAKKNVKLNDFDGRIQLIGRKPDDALIPLEDLKMDSIDFTMTNPLLRIRGSNEMVTQGGEVGFISQIFEESLVLRERVQWYTAMVGFLSSLTRIVDKLREHKIDNYAITEFHQGNKTRRWAIAWSFRPLRPAQSVARGTKAALSRGILPALTEVLAYRMPLGGSVGGFAENLSNAIAALDLISWNWDKEKLEGIGRAVDKVWGRPWRRRKKRELEMGIETEEKSKATEEQICAFGFKVSVRGFLKSASEKAAEDAKKGA
ncbi:hypothetical protein TrVFT333_008157 [Trichoderma virens FT-333]|nr:hypothetical protein TrVFT333_008157 [Trichoderma virens FT-333]